VTALNEAQSKQRSFKLMKFLHLREYKTRKWYIIRNHFLYKDRWFKTKFSQFIFHT